MSCVAAVSSANTQTLAKEDHHQQTAVLSKAFLEHKPSVPHSADPFSSLPSSNTILAKYLLQTQGRAPNTTSHCSGTADAFAMNNSVLKKITFKNCCNIERGVLKHVLSHQAHPN